MKNVLLACYSKVCKSQCGQIEYYFRKRREMIGAVSCTVNRMQAKAEKAAAKAQARLEAIAIKTAAAQAKVQARMWAHSMRDRLANPPKGPPGARNPIQQVKSEPPKPPPGKMETRWIAPPNWDPRFAYNPESGSSSSQAPAKADWKQKWETSPLGYPEWDPKEGVSSKSPPDALSFPQSAWELGNASTKTPKAKGRAMYRRVEDVPVDDDWQNA